MTDYSDFIKRKASLDVESGFVPSNLGAHLFDFQSSIVEWACKRGRAAIFADTGLGKTAMQTEWARQVAEHTGGKVLIAAPLCVAQQTVEESVKFGIHIQYCRSPSDIGNAEIIITNYEMLDKFDPADFAGIVLDESSILKSHTSKTRALIIEMFQQTPYRLSCTATPSPNDHMELGNQAEFLGVMTRDEYLLRVREYCRRGQDLPQAKLLDIDVTSIRSAARQREALRKHIADNLSNEALAKTYGTHVRNIEKIIRREAWSNLP